MNAYEIRIRVTVIIEQDGWVAAGNTPEEALAALQLEEDRNGEITRWTVGDGDNGGYGDYQVMTNPLRLEIASAKEITPEGIAARKFSENSLSQIPWGSPCDCTTAEEMALYEAAKKIGLADCGCKYRWVDASMSRRRLKAVCCACDKVLLKPTPITTPAAE